MSEPTVGIFVRISKTQALSALRQMTVNNPDFRPGPWSIEDAEDLEAAARLIRREIAEAAARKEAAP